MSTSQSMDSAAAAEYLDITVDALYRAMYHKGLKGEKQDRRWTFRLEDLEAYRVSSQQQTALPAVPGENTEEDDALIEDLEESIDDVPASSADEAPDEVLPSCHRCQRSFASEREYIVEKFVEHGRPVFYPVCRDGRCDPALYALHQQELQRERERSSMMLQALREIRDHVQCIILAYEQAE